MVSIGTNALSKAQAAVPESKRNKAERGGKYLMIHTLSIHHHKKGGDPRPLK
jgi:hypothetical protein